MEDLIGKQVGPYQIVAQLGIGGMATVFKAYQPKMDRHVALKVLPRHFSKNPEFVSRFSREARVIANLEHPHILPVHDFGESGGYTYLVMRLVEGGSLSDLLKKNRRLELTQIRRIISQVGGALDYAHTKGVIHRDFKPGNVLMDEFGNCLLTDFGIAKLVEVTSHLTHTGGILGTPTYISPEQGEGKPIDNRSDIYSLGVVLYQMVVGDVPYKAGTPMAVIFKHIHHPLPLPRQRAPDLPEPVEKVILKALAKEPDDRFSTAAEMVNALQNAIGQPTAQIREAKKPEPDLEPDEVTIGSTAGPIEIPAEPPKKATKVETEPKEKVRAGRGWAYGILAIVLLAFLGGAGWYYYKNIFSAEPILKVESNPPGAGVYIDGGHVGTSPVKVEALAPGTHRVRISKNRYQEYTEDLFIQKNKPRILQAKLVPEPFSDLAANSSPAGAEVFVDDEKKGVTPIVIENLPKGTRRVILKKEGFDPWQGNVEIVPLQQAQISTDLVTIYGKLDVSSDPPGADVYIDEKNAGKTPLFLEKVIKGKRIIEVKKQGFDVWKDTVEISTAAIATIKANLLTVFGELNITSDPSDAMVFMDGKRVGETPLLLKEVEKGERKIRVSKPGFDEWEQEVQVEASRVSEVHAKLSSSFGSLRVKTIPDGAEIYIDGEKRGESTLELKEIKKGTVTVEASKTCYASVKKNVDMPGGKHVEVRFDMEAVCGELFVTSEPSGADWYMDGQHMGKTPGKAADVMMGDHQIRVVKEEYGDWIKSVRVTAGSSENVIADLGVRIIGRDSQFVKYANGVVNEEKTGLEWFVGPDRDTTWNEAKAWVESLNVAGGSWRMPTREELKTLYQKGAGTGNMTPLLENTGWLVWSGDTRGSSSAWAFYFLHGYGYWNDREYSSSARGFAVRSRKQ